MYVFLIKICFLEIPLLFDRVALYLHFVNTNCLINRQQMEFEQNGSVVKCFKYLLLKYYLDSTCKCLLTFRLSRHIGATSFEGVFDIKIYQVCVQSFQQNPSAVIVHLSFRHFLCSGKRSGIIFFKYPAPHNYCCLILLEFCRVIPVIFLFHRTSQGRYNLPLTLLSAQQISNLCRTLN